MYGQPCAELELNICLTILQNARLHFYVIRQLNVISLLCGKCIKLLPCPEQPEADLEGGRPPPHQSNPLALGDGLTPSLTVLLICDNARPTILWRQLRYFYSSST